MLRLMAPDILKFLNRADMPQAVTMEAVAQLSGVSLSTVSLVLRDKPGINMETRKRVLGAAKKLGYRRAYLTEHSRQQALTTIGLVVKSDNNESTPQANQFYSPVMAGIEAICRRQQTNLLFATIEVDDDNRPIELPRLFFDRQVDGILL